MHVAFVIFIARYNSGRTHKFMHSGATAGAAYK